MNRPYIDNLLKKVDSKYSLVIAAARRASQPWWMKKNMTLKRLQ